MDLSLLSKSNLERCESPEGFNHILNSWCPSDWTNAVAGEVGEACNLTKKLLRIESGLSGNIKLEDKDARIVRAMAAHELADALIYIDLAIQRLGFNTEDVVRDTFNSKSDDIKCKIKV